MRIETTFRSTFRFALLASAFVAAGGCSSSSSADDAPEDTAVADTATPTDDATTDAADAHAETDGAAIDAPVDTTSSCTPPKFTGLKKIDSVDDTTAHLSWDAASDSVLPPTAINYFVYGAPEGTSIDFTKFLTTSVGKTDVVVTGLSKTTTYVFVVRASNGKCQDGNFVVHLATTKASCKFTQVQAIYDRNCAVSGCHVLPTPPQDMNLSSGFSFGKTVNVVSVENAPMFRITPNDSEHSYLYLKITGRPAAGTAAMPPPGASSIPTTEEKDLIKCWIDNGATMP